MTIVIACKFWKTVGVIADCRVSYGPPYEEVDDCLQKLYQIHNRLVVGFAGPLQGAYEVMKLVRKNALRPPRHIIADNLQADVERWIRHKYKELDARHRKHLSFVIATIEPSREKRSRWFRGGKEIPKPTWFPYVPEWNTFTLRPSRSKPGELVKEQNQFAEIIGVRGQDRAVVERILVDGCHFAFKQPMTQMTAIMDSLTLEFMRRRVKAVGGLLQCALLNQRGIQWLGHRGRNVVLEPVQGRFVQRDTDTGKTLPLMTIWEWAKAKPLPGSFGTFEDPDLRKAVEDSSRAGDDKITDC